MPKGKCFCLDVVDQSLQMRGSAIYSLILDPVAVTVRYNLIYKKINFPKQMTQPYGITC